ncbi:MAG: 2Fe-2S iron-sulfur cluster-binding protein [Pseudomonadota bacterium]
MFEITISETEERFVCRDDQTVLAAMEKLGRRGIPIGCRGGGCGICRVQVLGKGEYRTLKMSRAQVSEADEAQGICLACKLIPQADLTVQPMGLLQKRAWADNPIPYSRPNLA